jgi:small subunit ribosomal protein S20
MVPGEVDRGRAVRYDPVCEAATNRALKKEISLPKPSRKGISASKRLRQALKRRQRNRSVKSKTRTLVVKAITLIGDDAAAAESAVRDAISGLDRAAQKGVIHPNAAARSKSRLLKRFNLATASAVAAAATAKPAAPAKEAPKTGRGRTTKATGGTTAAKKPATRSTKAAPKSTEGRGSRTKKS